METLAYLQMVQEQESPDTELTLDAVKISGKLTGVLLGAAGAAIAVGITSAPAQAYHYGGGYDSGYYGGGYDEGCYGGGYDYGCGGSSPVYLGGGYQVTTFQTYQVSYDSGCYDHGCGGGYDVGYYDGGYDSGCYDYGCGGGWGGSIGWGGGSGCFDYGCGGGWGGSIGWGGGSGCFDSCGGDYHDVGYGYSTYDIQVALNYAGFGVAVDGIFGPETDAAVVAFQLAYGLVPDGVVGPATAHALGLY